MRDSGKKILTPSHSKQTPLQNPIAFTRDGVLFLRVRKIAGSTSAMTG
ncbi:hypothetical protein [Cyclobacterium amurskyense]